jgi:hypothetical protein
MSKRIIKILEDLADGYKFTILHNLQGRIEDLIIANCGSVYGIAVESPNDIMRDNMPLKAFPNEPNLYPVYWGVDQKPLSRILAHVYNYENTGNAKILTHPELVGKKVYFGIVLIKEFRELEIILHKKYPPLIGDGRRGRISTKIRIEELP